MNWKPTGSKRKISPKEQGNRGIFPSTKVIGGIVEYESCLERDFYIVLEHAPSVISFQHQPIVIKYKDDKQRKYTPDVFVEYQNGKKALYEIKYEEELRNNKKKYENRWNAANEWSLEHGTLFKVLTEKEIRTPRKENVWFTLGASFTTLNSMYTPKLNLIIPNEGLSYNKLCIIMAEEFGITINKAAQIVCYAIYHGIVFVDAFSTNQISKSTIIRRRQIKTKSCFKPLFNEIHYENQIEKELTTKTNSQSIYLDFEELKPISFNLPQKYKEKILLKEKIVKKWLMQPPLKRNENWREKFCNEWNVKESSVYRWVKQYESDGIEGLIPNFHNSGRSSKFSKDIQIIMDDMRKLYCKPQKTLNQAFRELKKLCFEKNISDIPNKHTFESYIYSNTTSAELAKKHGKKYFKSNFTPSLSSFQGAYYPMQIVQMDNTSFDVFPVDSEERKRLSTPYMTAAIDCYTRLITGFNISYFPSSARSVIEVLIQSILPKKKYCEIYTSQQNWPIEGFPVMILVDNGMDYRSKKLREFCIANNIILEFAPIRTPRYKALIEQWFNILRLTLKDEDVPGTRPLLKSRLENPELKPELEAVFTLQQIEEWCHKWVIDEYHFTNPYKGRVLAPFLRWEDVLKGKGELILPLPRESPIHKSNLDMLYLSSLSKYERKLSYNGITWQHLKYNSKELSKIHNVKGNIDIGILIDSRDIRNVWVINPITERPLKVLLASGWAQALANIHNDKPINASAWIEEIKILRNRVDERITPYKYQKEISRIEREEIVYHAKKLTRTIRKNKEKLKENERKGIHSKVFSNNSQLCETPENESNFSIEDVFTTQDEENSEEKFFLEYYKTNHDMEDEEY